jgi:hypothetical protein
MATAIKQTRGAALWSRRLGDQFGGEVKVEIAQYELAFKRKSHVLEGLTGPFQLKKKWILASACLGYGAIQFV